MRVGQPQDDRLARAAGLLDARGAVELADGVHAGAGAAFAPASRSYPARIGDGLNPQMVA